MKTGVTPLNLRAERDTLLYVPEPAPDPAPLVVYLHGATGNEQQGIRRLSGLADEFGFLLLSPASREGTWDAIRSDFGGDGADPCNCIFDYLQDVSPIHG